MKQVLQDLRRGKTLVAEVPVPRPDSGQVLVRTAASLVSAGTERMLVEFAGKSLLGKARSRPDLLKQVIEKARRDGLLTAFDAAFNRLDQPVPLGYSSAGTIVALGSEVAGLRVGQRVACAGGGYASHAEYAAVPHRLVAPLPDGVDFEAAAFTTLGAIALHGFRLAGPQIGERVAVIGLGLLGLLASSIAQAAGCQVFGVDLDARRVALALEMGAVAVARPGAEEAAAAFTHGLGCDAVLVCADSASPDPVELAGAIARDRARVVAVGAVNLQLPRKLYYEKELAFINSRSYGPGRYDPAYEEGGRDYPVGYVRWTEGRNLEAFVDLLAQGKVAVSRLVTHRFPIDQADQAYRLIAGKTGAAFLGVLLTYPAPPEAAGLEPGVELAPKNPYARPQGVEKATSVRLGVLGAGDFASAVMLPVLQRAAGVELVGIASASGASARSAALRFGFQRAVGSEAELLEDPEVNTVAILTRHHLHARQALAALSSGRHVFCEKPLALTAQELGEVSAALQDLGQSSHENPEDRMPLLTVGFNRRFAPLAARMMAFLQDRREPLYCHYRVNAGYLPPDHWTQDPRQGGGRILGEACHFIDYLTFLVGRPPAAVTAAGLPDLGRYREDNFLLTLEYPDGSLGAVSYLANGDRSIAKERVEVFCAGQVAVLDDFRRLELVSGGRRRVHASRLRQDKGHQAEWRAFSAAILQSGPPPIPYDQLIGVSRAALAAVQSLRSGQKVILD